MSLTDLSTEYRRQAGALRTRILELEQSRKRTNSPQQRDRLQQRIHSLSELWREARDLAVLTERYYERGYRRNARYTL